MKNTIEIYQSANHEAQLRVQFVAETVWLNRQQMALLFNRDVKTIGKHISNIFKESELEENRTVANFATVQKEGEREVERNVEHYNLDVIISVGYRVKSKQGTQFRQWATARLKEYLVQGYVLNQRRLEEKNMQVEDLKTGIRILHRAVETAAKEGGNLALFAAGLELLDDYDHEQLDNGGKTTKAAVFPSITDYLKEIKKLQSDFASSVFAKPKDEGFQSAVAQIEQSFGGLELYPSIEEKAATLLYLIVKNHPFVDGNKRIGAACFLYFLAQNKLLFYADNKPVMEGNTLAALTLFVASSKPEEMETIKKLIVSILNRA